MTDFKGTVVFASGKTGDYDIWKLQLSSGSLTRLTSGAYWNDCPRWSPDGTKILFVSNRTGTPQIWVMDDTGANQKAVTANNRWHGTPDWSPDGKSIVFCANYDGNSDIFTLNADGSGLQKITDYPEMDFTPSFSPDGKKIVFTSKRSGNDDIWTYDCSTRAYTRMTDYAERDFSPCYSPDGKTIAFARGTFAADIVTGATEDLDIWLMDADGGNKRRLSENIGTDRHAAWSPDGKQLIYTSSRPRTAAERLMIIDTTTGKSAPVSYERSALEKEIDAEPRGFGIFKILKKSILRKFYPQSYFGTERCPDWKA